MKTYLLACLLVVAGALGYLAYENRRQTNLQEKVLTRLQNATQKANREAAQTLQKIEKRDESALLAMLQKMRPTIGIADAAGKFLDLRPYVQRGMTLHLRAITDSVLLARFPNEFRYKIGSYTVSSFGGGYSVGYMRRQDSLLVWQSAHQRCYYQGIDLKSVIHQDAKGKQTEISPANYAQISFMAQ